MLSYSSHEADGITVLTAEKVADGDAPSAQRESLYKMIESRDEPRFAIDLGRIDYMSSSEIGFLITLKRRIETRKGKVVLFQVDEFIFDLFKMMRLDKLFLFATDMTDAVAKLN